MLALHNTLFQNGNLTADHLNSPVFTLSCSSETSRETTKHYIMSDGKSNINNSNNTRIHSSRIRTVRSPTVHALVAIYEMSTPGEGGPQVNKFEHVSGLGHQMPVPGEVPVRWVGSGQGGTLYIGGTRPMLAESSVWSCPTHPL